MGVLYTWVDTKGVLPVVYRDNIRDRFYNEKQTNTSKKG